MELLLSQSTGQRAFNEVRHDVDLKGSEAFAYRLGYSTPIHKDQKLAVGLEHYTDELEDASTGFSVQYRFDL